jgi:hypothetical protein
LVTQWKLVCAIILGRLKNWLRWEMPLCRLQRSAAPIKNAVEGEVMKKATTFLFVVLNGTWALMAYMFYRSGVRPTLIVTVLAIGALLGNVALYVGVRFAQKLLRKNG